MHAHGDGGLDIKEGEGGDGLGWDGLGWALEWTYRLILQGQK